MTDLIEAYYLVARDMERRAQQMWDIAGSLGSLADQMSEAEMKKKQPAEGKTSAQEVK